MKKALVCAIAIVAVFAGALANGAGTPASLAAPSNRVFKIMPLGDSITFGWPDRDYGGYRHSLGTLLAQDGYTVHFVGSQQSGTGVIPDPANEGHPGWTIPQLKNGIDTRHWLETYQPEIILLHIGTNDLHKGGAASAPANLSALLDDILGRLPHAYVIVAQIIPFRRGPDKAYQTYVAAIPGLAASKGPRVSTVDMQTILSKTDYADVLHPNAGGYDKMARAWEGAIRAVVSGMKGQAPTIPASPQGAPVALAAATTQGAAAALVPSADGQTVYDTTLHVTWLANGNLAAAEKFGVGGVNSNGSMTYAAAVRWVQALDAYHTGEGYLGHNNWQLPTTPEKDRTYAHTGRHGESFGFGCSGSTLGSLYYTELGLQEPNTAVPISDTAVGPFHNFQPYLYWSAAAAADAKQGFISFSFNTGFQGANVPPNYLYVLPMIPHKLAGTPPATGRGLQVNPGGKTVYDPVAKVTWLADANLAATQALGIKEINPDGAMTHPTAVRWIHALNTAEHGRGYLGQTDWKLPESKPSDQPSCTDGRTGFGCTGSDMGELFYNQLGLHPGQSVVAPPDVRVGPFHNIQPYLYWACSGKTAQAHCEDRGPAPNFEWNFSFGNGFQGTNLVGNALYVIVYYPGAPAALLPAVAPHR